MRPRHGVTRTVIFTHGWVVKVPSLRYHNLVRGWLANQSEWRQRHRAGVNPPVLTLLHFATVYPRLIPCEPWEQLPLRAAGYRGDEAKPSSWGVRPDGQRVLIDFDRAWMNPRGIVGRLYFGHQERLARKWMAL